MIGKVREEIEKAGGRVESTTRLGKRSFARKLDRQESGHYVVIGFHLPAAQVKPLAERYQLMEGILRVQILGASPAPAARPPDKDGNPDAVA
jgi:ribosomal protein S6